MSVSDLTNTSWAFSILSGNNVGDLVAKSINGVVVGTGVDLPNFSGIKVNSNSQIQFYADFHMSGENMWKTASGYFSTPLIINITGGTDTTDSTLISWLESNATQLLVTDLTDTTWVFNDSIDVTTTGVTPVIDGFSHYKYINFTSNNADYEELKVGSSNGNRWNGFLYNNNAAYFGGSWYDEAYKTIAITDGDDVTDTSLILWLSQNATLQESSSGEDDSQDEPSAVEKNIYIADKQLNKLYCGDKEIISIYYGSTKIWGAGETIAIDGVLLDSDGNYLLDSDGYYLEYLECYTITSTITNGSYSGDTSISNTASVTISANTGYSLPSTISVSGATYTYNSTTGVVSLSSPTGNVTIEATCVASYPVKSDIITMNIDGTNKQFRVLKQVNGSIFDVMSMFGIEHAYGSQYSYDAPSSLKTYLENDYYNTFTTEAKNAIVEAQQYRPAEVQIRNISTMGSDTTKYYNQSPTNASQIEEITLSSEIKINYKIRPITIKDIVEYIDKWKFNFNDIRMMFANNTTTFTYCALPNHKYGQNSYIFGMSNGSLNNTYQVSSSTSRTFRIKLQIDLSKINFTKN